MEGRNSYLAAGRITGVTWLGRMVSVRRVDLIPKPWGPLKGLNHGGDVWERCSRSTMENGWSKIMARGSKEVVVIKGKDGGHLFQGGNGDGGNNRWIWGVRRG